MAELELKLCSSSALRVLKARPNKSEQAGMVHINMFSKMDDAGSDMTSREQMHSLSSIAMSQHACGTTLLSIWVVCQAQVYLRVRLHWLSCKQLHKTEHYVMFSCIKSQHCMDVRASAFPVCAKSAVSCLTFIRSTRCRQLVVAASSCPQVSLEGLLLKS